MRYLVEGKLQDWNYKNLEAWSLRWNFQKLIQVKVSKFSQFVFVNIWVLWTYLCLLNALWMEKLFWKLSFSFSILLKFVNWVTKLSSCLSFSPNKPPFKLNHFMIFQILYINSWKWFAADHIHVYKFQMIMILANILKRVIKLGEISSSSVPNWYKMSYKFIFQFSSYIIAFSKLYHIA